VPSWPNATARQSPTNISSGHVPKMTDLSILLANGLVQQMSDLESPTRGAGGKQAVTHAATSSCLSGTVTKCCQPPRERCDSETTNVQGRVQSMHSVEHVGT
jgi:hypothetical protein